MDTRRALHELSPGPTRIDRKAPSLGPGDEEWPRPDPTRKGAEPPRNQRDRTNDLEGDVRNNPHCRPLRPDPDSHESVGAHLVHQRSRPDPAGPKDPQPAASLGGTR